MPKKYTVLALLSLSLTLHASINRTMDDNGDGKPDQWFIIEDGVVTEYMADNDYDGRVDHKAVYDRKRRLIYQEFDFNYDGIMDDFYYYENGILLRQEIDSNYDNRIDIWVYLWEGKYVERIESDTDYDGEIDSVTDYGG